MNPQIPCPECGGCGRRHTLSHDASITCILCSGTGLTSPEFAPRPRCRHPHTKQRWHRGRPRDGDTVWDSNWATECRCQQPLREATGRRLPLPTTTRTHIGRPLVETSH